MWSVSNQQVSTLNLHNAICQLYLNKTKEWKKINKIVHRQLQKHFIMLIFANFLSLNSVQLLSCVWLFATPWTAAHQASLSITNSWSLPRLMSIESVVPSNHLILCCPLLLLPSIFPSIRVFSNESALCIRWAMTITKNAIKKKKKR